jgi:cytolysin-activating lysine-acyltransferase
MTEPITVSHLFGEICWLFTQSPIHKRLPIATLEAVVMPALLHEQVYVSRDGDKPVGAILWAYCSQDAEKKLEKGLLGGDQRFTDADWKSGDRLWLVDLVAPFATDQNRHKELMLSDLIAGPLRDKAFRFHKTELPSGKRTVVDVPANAADLIAAELKAAGVVTSGS